MLSGVKHWGCPKSGAVVAAERDREGVQFRIRLDGGKERQTLYDLRRSLDLFFKGSSKLNLLQHRLPYNILTEQSRSVVADRNIM